MPKIKHIIEGIISEEEKDWKKGIVFYQFGKHLSDRNNEPIIDQHVLRAYELYHRESNDHNNEPTRKTSAADKKNNLIKAYKNWLQTGLTEELRNYEDYTYHVDKVLFALGKYAKSKSLS